MDTDDCLECSLAAVDLSQTVPLNVAIPVYGYVMPLVVALTTMTNTFVVVTLSQKHLRTPTNFLFASMAIADLLTGLTSLPWFLFYYTMAGYKTDEESGLPHLWCRIYPYFSHVVPTVFHTTGIWLTVFVAVQRYVYVCVPGKVHRFCTPRTTKNAAGAILTFALLLELPNILLKHTESIEWPDRRVCVIRYSPIIIDWLGVELYYTLHYWIRAVLVHVMPCALLIIFTYKLSHTITKTELRKRSCFSTGEHGEWVDEARLNTLSSRRSLHATNRMLSAVCGVFLMIEIPAAFIFISHYFIASNMSESSPEAYRVLNVALIIRNLLIVLTSPLQFAIYCSMSEQFRLTARQLFTSKLLFIPQAQATFHGGKRYSLILVDVDLIEKKRRQRRRDTQTRQLGPALAGRRSVQQPGRAQPPGRFARASSATALFATRRSSDFFKRDSVPLA